MGNAKASTSGNGQRYGPHAFFFINQSHTEEVGPEVAILIARGTSRMSKTSLSDLPFIENVNDFGTERYVNGLIKFIENSSAPLTIALQGEWGSGKTSLMTKLERELCSGSDSHFIGIEINTWEHSMLSSPEATVYKILIHLVRELTKNDADSKKTFRNFLRGAGNFLYRGARESLKTIPGVGGMLAVGLEAANIPAQLPDPTDEATPASLSDLKKALGAAVHKSITEADKRGVIIFVDDLDRLNPPVAVEILELLKNIFTLDNCIFVLAIDYDVVVKGLKPKFGELTEKNEREFRSFFDKIIQVPFSLPVNNYRPMDFVLKSLVDIGYINGLDKSDAQIQAQFSTVVEASVGKNPRSIKRLINTLSLLDCIAQCGYEAENIPEGSADDKLLNFVVVSIQICYPKIYRMLSANPAFTEWDSSFAQRMGISTADLMDKEAKDQDAEVLWEDVLEAVCDTDTYLRQHREDISRLLHMILTILSKSGQTTSESLAEKMREILDKSSVTGINADFRTEDFDKEERQKVMEKLYNNIQNIIRAKLPEIVKERYNKSGIKLKRNTGNGGLYIKSADRKHNEIELTLTLSIVPDTKKVRLELSVDPYADNPGFFDGLTIHNARIEPGISENLKRLECSLNRLKSENGWLTEDSHGNNGFYIELDKPSYFENMKVAETIADVLIAYYDFRKSMNEKF